jgi:hypothetical protein
MRLASVIALSSLVAFAGGQNAQKRTTGVLGTPVIYTFTNISCQVIGDHLQTILEPGGRVFKPFTMVNGNPTLTFTPPSGYKTTFTFGGPMTHVALRQDFCRVEINGAGATAEDASKGNRDGFLELNTFVFCTVSKTAPGPEALRAKVRSTVCAGQ